MKKIILAFVGFVGLLSSFTSRSQTFTVAVPSDTVIATIASTGAPSNAITNITGSNITMKWHVDSTSFPADWLTAAALGICDDYICRGNNYNVLWNATTKSGDTFTSTYYSNSAHDSTGTFYLSLDLTSATSLGSHWITINVMDSATGASKNLTFIINKIPVAVPVIPNVETSTILYPNPATSELNIVYDASADVKNIAIYNIIGKMMTVYKVNGPSANLNLENIPSGFYFVRLVNAHGEVVVTRKFTKQ